MPEKGTLECEVTRMPPRGLHGKIVYDILPKFAEKMRKEGLISDHDRKQLEINLVEGWEPLRVNPDLALHVPGRGKVVVEVVNPNKTKRFMGELIYPHVLGSLQKIQAVIFFVLPTPKSKKSERAMVQELSLHRFFEKQIPSMALYLDTSDLDEIYHTFRCSITDYKNRGKFY